MRSVHSILAPWSLVACTSMEMLTFLLFLTLSVKRTHKTKHERKKRSCIIFNGWLFLVGHGVNGSLLTF